MNIHTIKDTCIHIHMQIHIYKPNQSSTQIPHFPPRGKVFSKQDGCASHTQNVNLRIVGQPERGRASSGSCS